MKLPCSSPCLAVLLALATLPAGFAAARAEDGTAGAPGEWLSQYASARTLGLGGAYVATSNDPFGVLWNPAGLSMMDQDELRFETARLYEGTAINGFSLAVPGSRLPSFGLTLLSLRSGDFQRTNELNDPLGSFSEGETGYLFTVARTLSSRAALGANLKLVQQSIEQWSAQGVGFDVGGIIAVTPELRVGASAMNLGGPSIKLRDTPETYPVQMRGGFALAVLGGRGLVTAQLDHSEGLGTRIHGGAEYWMLSGLALRLGYDDSRATGGFSYRFAPQYQVDYGVADHPLGMTHHVGLSYRFGGFFASSAADPSVFSPTGERAVTRISLNSRTKTPPESWSLEIVNKSDAVVRSYGGKDQPPSHVEWDGKDETGLPLPDGRYRYRLVVKDREGRTVTSTTRMVEISTGGPQGSVPVVPTP